MRRSSLSWRMCPILTRMKMMVLYLPHKYLSLSWKSVFLTFTYPLSPTFTWSLLYMTVASLSFKCAKRLVEAICARNSGIVLSRWRWWFQPIENRSVPADPAPPGRKVLQSFVQCSCKVSVVSQSSLWPSLNSSWSQMEFSSSKTIMSEHLDPFSVL